MSGRQYVKTAGLLTLSTGIVMGDFSEAHEAAEVVMGHPVWTHEFPALADCIQRSIAAQLPDFPTRVPNGDWRSLRDATIAKYGETIEIERGTDARSSSPIETLSAMLTERQGGAS